MLIHMTYKVKNDKLKCVMFYNHQKGLINTNGHH